MKQKLQEFVSGLFGLLLLIFIVMWCISSYRSTEQAYVCSGSFIEQGKREKTLNVKFEIENSYSGIPWSDKHFMSVKMLDNAPYVFYHSMNALGDEHNLNWNTGLDFHWSRTYYGKDLSIWISKERTSTFSPAQMISFDFQTKILEIVIWKDAGEIRAAEYNMICKEVK